MFPKRQVLGMIIPGLWIAGSQSSGPSKPDQEVRQRNTVDRGTAEIQTVNSRCLKPVELEDTKYLP